MSGLTRGRAQLISFTFKGGRVGLRWMVPLLQDERDPSSWASWAEPTGDELHEVNADRVAGLVDARGRPRRWLAQDWRDAADRFGFELPEGEAVNEALRVAWEIHLAAERELPEGDELRQAIQAQVELPF